MLLPIYEWSPCTWWLAAFEAKGGCCANAAAYTGMITSCVMACCIWGKRRLLCKCYYLYMNDHLVHDGLLHLRQKEVDVQMLLPIYEWSPRTWWLAAFEAKGGWCANATTYIWMITSYVIACYVWGKRRLLCKCYYLYMNDHLVRDGLLHLRQKEVQLSP